MLKRQRFRFLLYLFLIAFPFVIMVVVNEFSPAPTFEKASTCTRYCHNKGCPHTATKYGEGSMKEGVGKLYADNITWLKNNPWGLTYAEVNIAIYVIGLPGLMALLLWGAIRKGKERAHG